MTALGVLGVIGSKTHYYIMIYYVYVCVVRNTYIYILYNYVYIYIYIHIIYIYIYIQYIIYIYISFVHLACEMMMEGLSIINLVAVRTSAISAGFAQPDGSSQGSSLCTTGIRPSWEQLGSSWAGKFPMTRSDMVWHGDLPWTSKITSWRVSVAPKPVDFGVLAKVWLKQAKEERQKKVRTQTVPYPGMAREENVDGIYDDHRVTWHCQLHLWQSRP